MNRNNPFEWSESEGQLFTTLITQMGGLYTDNPQGEYKTNEIDSFINEAGGVAYTNLTSPNGYSKSGNIVFGKGFVEDNPSPEPVYDKNWFYVENIGEETNTFTVSFEVWQEEPAQFTFEISEDGETWEEYTISSDSEAPQFSMEFTEKLYVRAKTDTYYVEDEDENGYNIQMGCMNPFNVGGNIMSLLYGSEFTGNETVFPQDSIYTFSSLFYEASTLVSAKDLILPATTLAEYCYESMFHGCTSLTEAPKLPATTLSYYCYSEMFEDCTSLAVAPQLPATTLAESCYSSMFRGCGLLTSTPQLPATILAKSCYSSMFRGCGLLTVAPELPATELASGCYSEMFAVCTSLESVIVHVTGEWDTENTDYWLYHVAQTGTLYNLGGATGIPLNYSGCPSGWTIETTPPEPHPETLDWFYVEDISGTENVLTITANKYTSESLNLSYSYDKISWTSININANHNIGEINFLAPNTKIYLRAKSQHWGGYRRRDDYWANIDCEGKYSVGGNIMSLLFGVNFSDKTMLTSNNGYAFSNIFSESRTLISAKNLILPATTLAESCYDSMFSGCKSLTTAPQLPATELAQDCYSSMFMDCRLLTSTPQLPATELAQGCYDSMFSGCKSLTTAPQLPATTLAQGCYSSMFMDCTSLNKIITYANDISAIDCLNRWLYNVASSGTFYNLGTASYSTGPSGIPEGWTIETSE